MSYLTMFLLPFISLLLLLTKTVQNADLNVGTTLFTKADGYKECWSSENLALLTSRMILEDLLPSTTILVIDSNEFVTDLVEYFRLILEIVRKETHGKTKHITLVALTDLLGGYLHHAVLPIAKFAYYAGLIDYDSMATLMGLFDELKWFLRTNGQGWAKPLPQNLENFEIQRIPLQPYSDKHICSNLVLYGEENGKNDVNIPLPFFDSITQPSAIALPTKTCPLHNVETNSSSYLVMKFFITAYKCLQARNCKADSIQKFSNDLCGWIDNQVMPRLEDDKFYAAFGGILRVRNTLKRLGISQSDLNKQIDEFRTAEVVKTEPTPQEKPPMSKSSMVLMAVLTTIFVWFILGTIFICYKMRNSKKTICEEPECECDKRTSSSLISSKYFYPEKPKSSDTKSTPETEHTSPSARKHQSNDKKAKIKFPGDCLRYQKLNWGCAPSKDKGHCHEITINTCACHEDGSSGTNLNESNPTEGRLASITEMSEQSTPETAGNKTGANSTAASSVDNKGRYQVQKQIYVDTETETEETTEGEN